MWCYMYFSPGSSFCTKPHHHRCCFFSCFLDFVKWSVSPFWNNNHSHMHGHNHSHNEPAGSWRNDAWSDHVFECFAKFILSRAIKFFCTIMRRRGWIPSEFSSGQGGTMDCYKKLDWLAEPVTGQNNYTRAGPTFRVGGGFSQTPPIFEHYQQHFIGFEIWVDTGIFC